MNFKNIFNKYKNYISAIFLIFAILIIGISFIFNYHSYITVLLSNIFTILGIMIFSFDFNQRNRGFEKVIESKRKSKCYYSPTRATDGSMGYDFYSNDEYIVKPNEIIKIWTDIKAYMNKDEGLIINVRSSMGGKFMLANTQGWIDSDYYSNSDNDGNIGIFLKNISNQTQLIKKGDRIAQGKFEKYLIIDNDNVKNKRKGGFGSTND